MPKIACRYCRKEVEYQSVDDAPFFPFCSERCKMIDLGLWLEEEHRLEDPLPESHVETEDGENEETEDREGASS